MKKASIIGAALLFGSLAASRTAVGQQYTATFLPVPAGYTQVRTPGLDAGLGIGGGQQVAQAYSSFFGPTTNILYNGSTGAIVDFGSNATLYGVGGGQQVGAVGSATSAVAALWNGDPNNRTILIPGNDQFMFRGSLAYGTDGMQQVGYGYRIVQPIGFLQYHALLWNGQAAEYVDLHPTGYLGSYAFGVRNGIQVGVGGSLGDNPLGNSFLSFSSANALLWTGSAASVVNLNPAGYTGSLAYATDGVQEVGWGEQGFNSAHALLWSGSANSYVDLNPVGFDGSQAYGINNGIEVGVGEINSGFFNTNSYALAWIGSSGNYVDLSTFLPAGYKNSAAYGIDTDGTIFGTAMNASGRTIPVLWTQVQSVPEPGIGLAGLVLMGMGTAWRLRKRKCK